MEEVEVKFLDIDPGAVEAKLKKLGAAKQFDRIFRRFVFDYPDLRLNGQNAWLRLRDEGDRITLTFKQRQEVTSQDASTNDGSMLEHEVTVSDFDKTTEILRSLGMKEKFYEENRRIQYKLKDIEFDIDFWPLLKPYLEIEAPGWGQIDGAIQLLGLNPKDKKIFSAWQVYQLAGINELDYKILTLEKQVKKQQWHAK